MGYNFHSSYGKKIAGDLKPKSNNYFTQLLEQKEKNQKLQYELVKLALKKGANPNEIKYFSVVPSYDTSRLLLETLDSTRFLNLILKPKNVFVSEDLGQEQELVNLTKLCQEKKADFGKIVEINTAICPALANLLLSQDQNISPDHLFELSISIPITTLTKQGIDVDVMLAKKAIERGACQNLYPWLEGINDYQITKLFWLHQDMFLLKLKHIQEKNPTLSKKIFPDKSNIFANESVKFGCCYGLTTLWGYITMLYSIDSNACKYTPDWFIKMFNSIVFYQGEILSENDERVKFLSLVLSFQSGQINGIQPDDVLKQLNVLGKKFKEKRCEYFTFTSKKQLEEYLQEIVHDKELVYVQYLAHTVGIIKINKDYYFFDVLRNGYLNKFGSITKLTEAIYKRATSNTDAKHFTLTFKVIGNAGSDTNSKNIIENNLTEVTKNIYSVDDLDAHVKSMLNTPSLLAYTLNALKNKTINIKFKDTSDEKHYIQLMLSLALLVDDPDVVKEILTNKNFNISVNDIVQAPNVEYLQQWELTYFFAAAFCGAFQSMQVMFDLNSIKDINQINGKIKKTVLDLAQDGKDDRFKKLEVLLKSKGAKTINELLEPNKKISNL